MGSWGVRAHESDRGLDYLGLIQDEILKPNDYRQFDVSVVLERLKNHIVKGIRHDFRPLTVKEIKFYKANNLPIPNDNGVLSEEQIQEYVDDNFPASFSHAVLLVAECLKEYFKTGKYVIHADTKREVSEFIFTSDSLEVLFNELLKILEPSHSTYKSWEDSESFDEWQSHVKMLCDSIKAVRGTMDKKVFDELKILRLKYERAKRLMEVFQSQMENCINKLNWHGDQDAILEIITQLPQSYLRFRMYEHYYDLDEKAEATEVETTPSSTQEGGAGNG